MNDPRPIVLYDGDCGLCSRPFRLLHRIDRKGKLREVMLFSDEGAAIIRRYALPVSRVDSLWLIVRGRVVMKSDALIEIAKILGGAYSLFAILKIIPRPIRDFSYDKIAANRYHWFGTANSCERE